MTPSAGRRGADAKVTDAMAILEAAEFGSERH